MKGNIFGGGEVKTKINNRKSYIYIYEREREREREREYTLQQ